eukprot:TRINITY_DN3310_c0_g2_i2.p1 TRINITY_DN3310_c0_g2~~TRINITY_DN3310_c0_g2_i2.p1  ORF type:complete len:208 (+),score=55.62 TRINITY_DN3310_c0_g2_i2:159-782(+)
MEEDNVEYDYMLKLLLIGDSDVGKSSILLRFTDDDFSDDISCTIGVDFKTKLIDFHNKKINLTIWDTAGQEKFRSLTSSYYRGTHGIILVYDVTNKKSFEHIESWLNEINTYATNDNLVKLLVGNKVDKEEDREVTKEEAQEFARSREMVFIEASAKTTIGIQQSFNELVQKIMDIPEMVKECSTKKTNNVNIDNKPPEDNNGSYCC